jgi:chromosomal replication initiator protein
VFGITKRDLVGNSRKARIAHPRCLAMALAKELTKSSYALIGREFGGRHHSTSLSNIRRAYVLMDSFPHYVDRRQAILAKLGFE